VSFLKQKDKLSSLLNTITDICGRTLKQKQISGARRNEREPRNSRVCIVPMRKTKTKTKNGNPRRL
jgi:hypothetical protein